ASTLLSLATEVGRPMGQVGRNLGIVPSHMSRLVDALEARGFVERVCCETDRRVRLIALTPRGVRCREQLARELFDPPAGVAALSCDDQQRLAHLLIKAASSPISTRM